MDLALVILVVLGAATDTTRVPVPNPAAQAGAERLLAEVYGEDIKAAETPEAKRALAREILGIARQDPDAANKYVCLQTAKRLALEARDGALALEVVQLLVAHFTSETEADAEGLIRRADLLWEAAEKKQGTEQLAGRVDALEAWLRAGSSSPLLAAKWEARTKEIQAGGTILLHAREAKFVGKQLCFSQQRQATAVWVNPYEYLGWQTTLPSGTYRVSIEYAADPNMAPGSLFALELLREHAKRPSFSLGFSLKNTGDWPTFISVPVGELKVPEDGKYVVHLRVVRKIARNPQMGIITFRSLELQAH